MNMPTTSLPVFRVAGMSGRISFDNEHAQRQQLWQDYDLSRLNDDLPAFSQTIYCVLHQYDDKGYTATLGRLVPNDVLLPENVDEVWVVPQCYAILSQPEKEFISAHKYWHQIRQNTKLNRLFKMDFESYPVKGDAKIYIGVEGDDSI